MTTNRIAASSMIHIFATCKRHSCQRCVEAIKREEFQEWVRRTAYVLGRAK